MSIVHKKLYKEIFGKKRNLAAKPKPWRINLLLYLAHVSWSIVKPHIVARFGQSKDIGYCTFIDLLDNLVPTTLDAYAILFREMILINISDKKLAKTISGIK